MMAKIFFQLPLSSSLFKLYQQQIKNNRKRLVTKYKKVGRILDVGFGDGKMLEAFSKDSWERFGVEINSYLAKQAEKNLKNATLIVSRLETASLSKSYFDLITLWHVFEHLENPQEILKIIRKLLKPDGVLVLEIPSGSSLFLKLFKGNWQQLIVPEHLYFYTEKSLKNLLKENGLKTIEVKYSGVFSFSGPSSLANYLRFKNNSPTLSSALAILSYPFFIATSLLSKKQRENMQLVAKRR